MFGSGGMKIPAIIELVRDSPNVNVFCAISKIKLYRSFFFVERTITGRTYLDMPENWLMPQMNEEVMITSFNKEAVRFIFIMTYEIISTEIFHNAA